MVQGSPVKKIVLSNVSIDANFSLGLDDVPESIPAPSGKKWEEVYAIDPARLNFTNGTVTAVAKGTELYKCKEWDFDAQACGGEWMFLMFITPGEEYSFVLTPDDPALGEGSDYYTLTTITIDGNLSDWAPILDNPNNVVSDGAQGVDDADTGQTADRDLLLYIDVDNDGLLENSDYVVSYSWTNNRRWDSDRYNYIPSNVSGDAITGDGTPEPGEINLTSVQAMESAILGGGANGIQMETRLNWSYLNITPGSPLQMHVSSTRGDASDLPDQVEDNIDAVSTLLVDVDIDPDREGSGNNGQTVYYNHTVTNLANINDTINIHTSATTLGFIVNLTYANGTPLTDTNADTKLDVGLLAPDESKNITVAITIVGASPGDIDNTYVIATSSNNSNVTDSVLDRTFIGSLVLYPSRIGSIINGSTIIYNHTVVSNLPGNNTININATSNNSYVVNVTYANGTYLTDTNSDGVIDIGNVSQGSITVIYVRIQVPGGVAIGSQDTTNVTASRASNPAISSTVTDTTTVAIPIEILPDRVGYAPVIGSIFYDHTVINSLNVTDVGDLTYNSLQGWAVTFFEADKITPLSDTDGDTIVDTGNISPFGGTKDISVRLYIAVAVPDDTFEQTNITANSSVLAWAYDNATDNTTARLMITYSDPANTVVSTLFTKNETVYAVSYGLTTYNKVYYRWYDSNGTLIRQSPVLDVDANDEAADDLPLNYTLPSGTYSVYIHNNQGGAEITHEFFEVFGTPNVTVVTPNGGEIWSANNTIYYNITDDSGQNATATIQYSPNGGVTWFNITTMLLNTTNCTADPSLQCVEGQFNYTWNTATVPDGTQYLIRVLANNTYFTGSDQSDAVFTIRNRCRIIDSPGKHVLAGNSLGAIFNASEVTGIDWACIKIASSDVVFSCKGYNITNNNTAEAAAIVINGSATVNYTNITIKDCPAVKYYERGIYVHQSTENRIWNSTIYNHTVNGFVVYQSTQINITGSTAYYNTQDGVNITESSDILLINNTAYNNTGDGFLIQSTNDINISGSNIYNNSQYGVRMINSSHVNLTNNNITGNSGNGLYFDSNSASNNLTSNYICFNSIDINNTGSTNNGTLDACDLFSNWFENGHKGCTYSCSHFWHRYFGNVNGTLVLADATGASTVYSWAASGFNVFFVDYDSNIDWLQLQAMGRNTSNQTSSNDFEELDAAFSSAGFFDSINTTYSTDGTLPKATDNYTVFARKIDHIPIDNSTVASTAFRTGILWDMSDGGTEYSNAINQSTVWMVTVNASTSDVYSTYDYLIQIPYTLASYEGANDIVSIYVELK